MFPFKLWDLYISQICLYSSWGGCPFEWDYDLKKVRHNYNKKRWLQSCSYWGLYTIYLTCRLMYSVVTKEFPVKDLILGIFILLSVYFLACAYFVLVLRFHDTIVLINSSFVYMKHLNVNYTKTPEDKGSTRLLIKLCYPWLKFTALVVFTAPIGFTLILMLKPFAIFSVMSVIPMEYRESIAVQVARPIYCWTVFRSVLSSGMSAHLVGSTLAMSWIVYYQIEDQLNLNTKTFWTKNHLRTPKNLHKEYTAISVLVRLTANATRDFTMWFQMTLTREVHVCCFLLIRHYQVLEIGFVFIAILTTVGITIAWIIIMQGAAVYFTSSSKIIRSWRKSKVINAKEAKVWKKIRRATKPLCIRVGNYYDVKPMTVVSIVENYFKGTIRLLLTFKAKS